VAGLVDSHCHLAHVERPPSEVLAEAEAAGVEAVIDIGMGLEESRAAADRARNSDGLYASVGFHPNDLAGYEADPATSMAELRALAALPNVVAVGETGLDLYRDRTSPALQEDAFRAHIALAKDAERALVIHCRDAHGRVLDVLDDAGPPVRVVMHCFSGDVAFARICGERHYFCSFAGNLTYKRSDELREAARVVPEDLLLVETDAPYLAPHPYRGKPNHPALLPNTVAALAEARSTSVEALTDVLRENVRRAFLIG
jgi:TatD DNase family protein